MTMSNFGNQNFNIYNEQLKYRRSRQKQILIEIPHLYNTIHIKIKIMRGVNNYP